MFFSVMFNIALFFMLVFAPTVRADDPVVIADFSSSVGRTGAPAGWDIKEKSGKADFAVVKDGDIAAGRFRSANSSFSLQKEVKVDLKQFPLLTWKWKVTKLPAGGDFSGRRFFVLAALALWFPFEMFYGIGDIDVVSRDPGFGQGLIQDVSCRTDERMTGSVFLVARLFADQDDLGMTCPFSEDGLCGLLVEIAAGAGGGGFLQGRDCQFCGNEGGGGAGRSHTLPYHAS